MLEKTIIAPLLGTLLWCEMIATDVTDWKLVKEPGELDRIKMVENEKNLVANEKVAEGIAAV